MQRTYALAALALAPAVAAQNKAILVEDYIPEAGLQMSSVNLGGPTVDVLAHFQGTPGSAADLYALPAGAPISEAVYLVSTRIAGSGKQVYTIPVPVDIWDSLPAGLQLDFIAVVADAGTGDIDITPVDTLMLGTLPCEQLDFDFDPDGNPILPGETLTTQYAKLGLTISCDNKTPGNPDKAIVFDSLNPTGEDDDLITPGFGPNNNVPLGNLMIVAEDDVDVAPADGLIDDPDDEAGGGVITYQFEDAVSFCDITLVDLDDGGGSELRFFLNNALIDTLPLPSGPENSVQVVGGFVAQFDRMEVDFVGSGAISNFSFVFCPTVINFDTFTSGESTNLVAGEVLTDQLDAIGVSVSALNNTMGNPNKAVLFDTTNVTGEDDDLATPGPGINNNEDLGLVLIIAEDDVDTAPADGLIDDPDDEQFGGSIDFEYSFDVIFKSAKLLDIDLDEGGALNFYDDGGMFITTLPLTPLGDNSVQTVAEDISGVRRIEVVLFGSGAIADLEVCPDFGGGVKL